MQATRSHDKPGASASHDDKTSHKAVGKSSRAAEAYNPPIRSNARHDEATQYQRPGVRLGGEPHGHDKFELSTNPAPRYRIKDGSQAALVDQLTGAQTVAVNPAHTRSLILIDTVSGAPPEAALPAPVSCVLTWEPLQGPAWMPITSLKEGAKLAPAADKLSKQDMPAAAPKDTKLVKYAFRDEPPSVLGRSHPTEKETTQHIAPHQPKGANKLDHYLERDDVKTQLGPDAPTRRYYNINLTPPQAHAPPIADDTAQPGDAFFVAQGGEFRQQVAIYDPASGNSKQARAHDKKPVSHQTWVYGFAAKTEGAHVVADRSRRGWVPLRDLKKL